MNTRNIVAEAAMAERDLGAKRLESFMNSLESLKILRKHPFLDRKRQTRSVIFLCHT